MGLLSLEDYTLKIKPEALAISAFKKIWNRDRSKNKSNAIRDLSYIYYMVDYKSEFSYILNDEKRHKEIVKILDKGDSLVIDDVMKEAIEIYKKSQETLSLQLLRNARISLQKLSEYIASIDYSERDKNNRPVHDIKKVKDTFQTLGDSIDAVAKAEEKVKKELQAENEARGKMEKNVFEDGFE
jgi:1,2-phenylacetyl-CoA epoxidase PaaB subunit